MAKDEFEEPGMWDEYRWERFLQQQDRNTEKYFTLLEKYMDHPDRDRIIALEMGWEYFEEEENSTWDEAAEVFCELDEDEQSLGDDDEFDTFTGSPIYSDTLELHSWVNKLLEKSPALQECPEASRMASCCSICGAKLAAALCGSDDSELGMTIAYLKRALKAANDALDASNKLRISGHLTRRQETAFQKHLFQVRNRVVDLMSEYRSEWRRRVDGTGKD